MPDTKLEQEIKELIVSSLALEDTTPKDIKTDQPLFVDGLGLDSIDALELAMALSKKYKIQMDGGTQGYRKHFASVASLAAFVTQKRKSQ